jgi:hypothetical protein
MRMVLTGMGTGMSMVMVGTTITDDACLKKRY